MCVFKESEKVLDRAAKILLEGKVISAMTETVYGLLGNAEDPRAIKAIYEFKKRPIFNPLIVHVNSIKMAKRIACFTKDAEKLSNSLWPGPLTLILKKKKSNICSTVTANLETIAIRFADSKIFSKIISKINKPIAAPSANISGFVSSTKPSHVKKYFKNKIDLIIDSGQSRYGIESTVINLTTCPYQILRLGIIEKKIIKDLLGKDIIEITKQNSKISSPGQLLKHYSTNTPIRMNAKKKLKGEAFLGFGEKQNEEKINLNLSKDSNLNEAAFNLFDYLIKLDKLNMRKIAISPIPDIGLGRVINDKLKRASKK